MNSEKYIKLGQKTALISFFIGLLIFLLYYYFRDSILIMIGYIFTLLAGIVNLVVLVLLWRYLKIDKENSKRIARTLVLMLLNVPIAAILLVYTFTLMNTIRITFTNSTAAALTNINVVGCETKRINRLEKGASETLSVKISERNCSVSINYVESGQFREEMVVEYGQAESGTKKEYKIGSINVSK